MEPSFVRAIGRSRNTNLPPHETQVLQWAYSALRMSEHKFWESGDGDSALDCHNSADMLQQTFDKFCAWIEDDYFENYENEHPDENH